MSAFEAAGVAVYALSYDEPEALADFAAEHATTFTLLSDPDSKVISGFGILNTLIPPDDHPWHGIPFPGAYIIDGEGIIRSKFFEGRLAIRASGDQLLRAVRGEPAPATDDAVLADLATDDVSTEPGDIEVRVWTKARHLPPGIVADLNVELTPPLGWHLYGAPVPAGMVATAVELDDGEQSIIVLDAALPVARPHVLEGTGETLQVFEPDDDGAIRVVVPFLHNGSKLNENREVTASGVVRWQVCDDSTCSLPGARRFELRIPTGAVVVPHYPSPERPLEPGQMDSARHLAKMRERRA